MVDRIRFCDGLAQKQAEMLSMVHTLGSRMFQGQGSNSSPISGSTGSCLGEFLQAVPKVLREFQMINDILVKSGERMTEHWLTPEAIQAKTLKSKYWTDLESILYGGQTKQLKEALASRGRSVVIKGGLKTSISNELCLPRVSLRRESASPTVGVLVATKRTRTDMENLEERISAWQNSAIAVSEIPRVTEEELQNATGDDYNYKLLCWGTDVAHLSVVSLVHDVALVKHTKDMKEFWTIDMLGVRESERGKGVGRQLIERVKEQAKGKDSPIIVCADRDAISFYIRCGFKTLETFTYRGNNGVRPDAIMKWV